MMRTIAVITLTLLGAVTLAQPQQEALGRGAVAMPSDEGVFISWRLLGEDPDGVAFNLYRHEGQAEPKLLNREPLRGATNYQDQDASDTRSLRYELREVIDGVEAEATEPFEVWKHDYLEIPIDPIEGYRPGDASVGDLDGDGELEIVLHQVLRPRDNGSAGVTGEPILDAYTLSGERLWRITLGKNVREGEHYTQFMVYDLDGDGCAEVACKTADGTIDGLGRVLGDPDKDWRTLQPGSPRHGRILDGPEYFSVFDGKTGAELATADYVPGRDPIDGWGGIGGNAGNDSYGNRCDRFLACVAYLDGERPSVVMCRGVYGRTAMTAWDWRDNQLKIRWRFDTGPDNPPYRDASAFAGMGGHSLSVGDIDDDGRDEIVYQAMVVDDNGEGIYSSGLRHGDAMHLTDIDPERPGQEVFTVQENENKAELFQTPAAALRDALTGEILWSHSPTVDAPSGMAADIDPTSAGLELWGGPGGLRSAKGQPIGRAPRQSSWCLWWDGDPLRELLSCGRPGYPRRGRSRRPRAGETTRDEPNDKVAEARREFWRRPQPTRIEKWDWVEKRETPLYTCDAIGANRGPSLLGDLVGDWREEMLLIAPDRRSLRLYSTTIPTDLRLTTLLHDRQYRLALVWQNVVYNKPPHTSFYLGSRMSVEREPEAQLDGE